MVSTLLISLNLFKDSSMASKISSRLVSQLWTTEFTEFDLTSKLPLPLIPEIDSLIPSPYPLRKVPPSPLPIPWNMALGLLRFVSLPACFLASLYSTRANV